MRSWEALNTLETAKERIAYAHGGGDGDVVELMRRSGGWLAMRR